MKRGQKYISICLVLTFTLQLFSVIGVYADTTYWDLDAMPDFTDYFLHEYGCQAGNEITLLSCGEPGFDSETAKKVTKEILPLLNTVSFEPVKAPVGYDEANFITYLYFAKAEDWSVVIHVYLMKEGISVIYWDTTKDEQHCAFLSSNTDALVSDIQAIMSESKTEVENLRKQQEQEKTEEREKGETEISFFNKLYTVSIPNLEFVKPATKSVLDFEFGVCEYQLINEHQTKVAYYFEIGNNEIYYLADDIDKNNVITYYDLQIYQRGNQYYMYDENKTVPKVNAQWHIDTNEELTQIDITILHSGFTASAQQKNFTETGDWKPYCAFVAENFDSDTDNNVEEEKPTEQSQGDTAKETKKETEDTKEVSKENEIKENTEQKEVQEQPKDAEETSTTVEEKQKENISWTYEDYAENLQRLGLFRGTENGYELESTFTRAQGATMLVRLLGMEQTALAMTPRGIFSDVPADDWAAPYIEYCYQNGITKGTSETTYSPEDAMSGSQYLTLVLRALRYQYAEPENADIPAAEYGLVSSKTAETICQTAELTRDTMVYISYQALSVKQADGQTLIEKLAAERAVDTAVARQLGLLE